jgi:hypothetical protein
MKLCFLALMTSQTFAAGFVVAFLQTEGSPMVELRTTDQDRLLGYLHANTKYFAAPVPAPLARLAVVEFLSASLKSPQTAQSLRKLVRLAVFYDVQEVAPAFEVFLREQGHQPVDHAQAALAIVALSWIGNDAQKQKAQSYFESLLKGFPDQRQRESMLEACDALGPREGTQPLRAWIQGGIAQLKANLQKSGQQKHADEVESSEDQLDELEEFMAVDITSQERANAVRAAIEAAPSSMDVIGQIEPLYIGDAPDATPRLSEWAALKLIRLADPSGNHRAKVAAEFVNISKRYQSVEEKRRAQAVLFRARCLRAADFFGYKLDNADSSWLSAQPDPGTDVLALRLRWKYPLRATAEK